MSPTIVRFRPEELSLLLEVLDPAGWVNLRPEADEEAGSPPEPSTSWVSNVFSNQGPIVPLATWHAGERSAGIQHSTGPRVARRIDVPVGWRVVQDHPRRGIVLRVPAVASEEDVLRWLITAATSLATIPLLGGWVAEVHAQ